MEHDSPKTSAGSSAALPAEGFVRAKQLVPSVLPFSEVTLWRKVKAGDFPQPVKLGQQITAWRVEDVRAWMAAR